MSRARIFALGVALAAGFTVGVVCISAPTAVVAGCSSC
jgi:hypothetical protein